MKQNKKSFAQLARDIKNKYKNASRDKLEATDMEAELTALALEQEQMREEMGLNQPQQEAPTQFYEGGDIPNNNRKSWDYPGKAVDWGLDKYQENAPDWLNNLTGTIGNIYDNTIGIMDYPGEYIGGTVPASGKIKGVSAAKKTYVPATSRFRNANPKVIQDAVKSAETKVAKQAVQEELTNAFGKPNRGPMRIGGTKYSTSGGVKTNQQLIDGKIYEVPTGRGSLSMPSNIPFKQIGYGAAGAGVLGAGIYGASNISGSEGYADTEYSRSGYTYPNFTSYNPIQEALSKRTKSPETPEEAVAQAQQQVAQQQTSQSGRQTTRQTAQQTAVNNTKSVKNSSLFKPNNENYIGNDAWMAEEADKVAANNTDVNIYDIPTATNKSWWDKNKGLAPYMLSGASNILGNLFLAKQSRDIPKINPILATPERVNMEPQAEALRAQAGVAKNVASVNARNLGLNSAQAMAGMSAASTGIDRNLGNTLTDLYTRQEQFNTETANRFALSNQEASNRANMMNNQMDYQSRDNRLGYLSGALGTIPGVMRDITQDKKDRHMQDVMRSYYNSMGRNYMVEGDIFTDPDSGFRYKVRNNELIKVN